MKEEFLPTDFFPTDTASTFKSAPTLKNVLLSGCISLFLLSASTTSNPTVLETPKGNVASVSVISTFPATWTRYNQGSICLYCEGASLMDENLQRNILRLEEIASLPENWNNNGASSFSQEHISKMKNILLALPVQPLVFPTARNSIQFEYEKQNGDYLEFELFEDGSVMQFSYSEANGSKAEATSCESIERTVRAFYE